MDSKHSAINLWPLLKSAIHDIQKKNNAHLKFEELYQYAYLMVRNDYGKELYKNIKDSISNRLVYEVRREILHSLPNNFLSTLIESWNDFRVEMVMIRDIFMYLDRVYVDINELESVYNVGLILFREEIIKHEVISNNLRSILLQMIMTERKGKTIDRRSLKNVCSMLVSLGINSNILYEEEFENAFLEQSKQFYREESCKFLLENDVKSYVEKVQLRFQEELERARECLTETSEKRILEILEEELIRKNITVVPELKNSDMVHALKFYKTNDLADKNVCH
ncbi:cullin-3-B-like [Centruroides vittatus]|uniref:cullin-3-B-like n=1 Tax=Centruroides vittatus TaxID=120091 RepID=UPI00350EA6EC